VDVRSVEMSGDADGNMKQVEGGPYVGMQPGGSRSTEPIGNPQSINNVDFSLR
jgi:hypothetical protein